MEVLVTVIDDNRDSQTFKLERVRETPRFVVFEAKEKDNPLIGKPPLFSRTHVMRSFRAARKA